MYFTRRNNNQYLITNFRINILQWVIFLLVISIITRLFYLQILQYDKYSQIAVRQHQAIETILPERGEIFALTNNKYDSGNYPLAINQITYEIYANPTEIIRPQNVMDILADVLELDSGLILDKLKKSNDKYEGIKKNVTESQVKNLEEKLDLLIDDINVNKSKKDKVYTAGIHWNKEILRYYPDKEIGAHILGFLGYDQEGVNRVGKYGIEGFWQEELAGTGSQMIADRVGGGGRLIPFSSLEAYAKDGADLVLTIDRTIQYQTCKSLEKAVAKYDAKSGSVIIMETDTGDELIFTVYKTSLTKMAFDPPIRYSSFI